MNDVSDVDLPEADHTVDRGRNRGVVKLGLGRFDRRLVGIDHCL